MAELADALDLGSSGQPCGFESHYPYQKGLLQNENAIAVCTRLETGNENRSPGEAVNEPPQIVRTAQKESLSRKIQF